jgi:hypothetical protein
MRDAIPEPRTAVMILVEASWEDQSGTLQRERARMENTSNSGACIRVKKQIDVGAKLRVHWRWEEFSGTARYCRKEGIDYLVGIQRDAKKSAVAKKAVSASVPAREGLRSGERNVSVSAVRAEQLPKQEQGKPKEIAVAKEEVESVPIVTIERIVNEMSPLGLGQETGSKESPGVLRTQGSDETLRNEPQRKQALKAKAQERKYMRSKLLDLAHWGNKQGESNESSNGIGNGPGETGKHAPEVTALAAERSAAGEARESGESFPGELLSMEDIYRAAGIVGPRRGYSINKVVEMLYSEHIRGLSKEMKRASVLMALDAAGVSIDEVAHDAEARQEAIDSYQAEQRKQFEAQWARKAEENLQIQAELETVKARYMERVRRNLDGVAREKATFGNWLTMKQREAQSMAEAVELCLKAPRAEAASGSLAEVSLIDASAKPV